MNSKQHMNKLLLYFRILLNIIYEKIYPLDYENFNKDGVRLRPRGVPCSDGSFRICGHCGLQDASKNKCNYFDENSLDSILFRMSIKKN